MNPNSSIRPCVAPTAPRRADCAWAFSIVELLVVMAMISILSAIAIPRFGGTVANYRVNAAARKIIADLAIARSQAMVSSAPQSVSFTPSSDSYQLDGLASADTRTGGYVVDLSREPYRVDLVWADFGGTVKVTFDMYGVPDSKGTIVVQSGSSQRTVSLDNLTGKASSP